MNRFALFIAFLVAFVLAAPSAFAFTPPPMTGHVTDAAGKLSATDRDALDQKLEAYRLRTTNEVAVFIPATLDGESIEDVGIETGRAWKLGVKGKDNGVLITIAPVERKARIDVGKGVEGDLTDIQSNDIIRSRIRPNLAAGHENYFAAASAASDGVIAALDKTGVSGGAASRSHHKNTVGNTVLVMFIVFGIAIFIVIVVLRSIFSSAFSSSTNRGWSSGGSSNDSWGGGGGDGGGGGGGSDFSGGGGDFGGGGSSDSF